VSLNVHHERAAKVITLAVLLDAALGAAYAASMHISTWRGMYYATGVATTSGNSPDTPVGWLPHVLTMLMMTTVIPLVAATFSLVTTGLTADHIDRRHEQIADHVTTTAGGGA
jgi:hypothetical protein